MRIGIDIGGTKIKAGLVNGEKIHRRIEIATEAEKGREKVIQNIISAIQSVYQKDIKGIGIGFAGMFEDGKIAKSPHIPSLEGFDIKRYVSKKFHKKVLADNEVKCATIAEAKYGAGKGHKNIVMITIGTGIGGGIITEGKLYKGKGNAGEVGHTTINFTGIKSTCCNNYGCLEEYASTRGLQRRYGKKISPKKIAELAEKGDKKAIQAYKELGRNLGAGINNIANSYDPEIIILGGGIAKSWELFQEEMHKMIKERGFVKTKVVKAKFEDAGIIGAALLIK